MSGPNGAAAVDEPVAGTSGGLRIRDLRKAYGQTVALDGLDLDAREGEILGVAGPNGAGKSTLIKILVDETDADSGEILLDGEPWVPAEHRDRVAVVHQEPQLFPNLSVGDNLMVGREGTRSARPRLSDEEKRLMADLGILDVASTLLERVPLAVQQRTEIGRALARSARIFLFDEPNSALTDDESEDLFRRMHLLADAGHVVILVSHRLAELVAHCQRVATILDGICTGVLEGERLTQENIAAALVVGQAGREAEISESEHTVHDADVLTLGGWTHVDGRFADVDLRVRAGEVVAILGVEGSGGRELVRSIAGFEKARGTYELSPAETAEDAELDSGFVSADRQASLFSNLTIGDNVVSRLSRRITRGGGFLRRDVMVRIADGVRESFQVKTSSMLLPIGSLSGGNQQKVAISAAIVERPEVLVLEEPTRGVDIGSKAEIYRLMHEYAASGHVVVIFCTEVPEVFEAADRAYVVSDGRLTDPVRVIDYDDVEGLARAITRLERHASATPARAHSAGDVDAGDSEGGEGEPSGSAGDG